MKFKRIATRLTALLLSFALCITASADMNLGNDDGTDFKDGDDDNYWGVYTDGGIPLNNTEGLRVTVYDADSNTKVFNTIDITGNPNIAAVSSINYFADGAELIPKTTWLKYIGSIYNSIAPNDMNKFNNTVLSKSQIGGYRSQYVPQLASIDIVSIDNTSHLDEIKNILSDREFLKSLCNLLDGLIYADIASGKYKIAFEPVAYFRYNGQNWAMSATECGLLNKYMKNYFSAGWNSTNNLRAKLGPLTHSNLPRSAFLESRDLDIPVYAPTDTDYYNGNTDYNSDICIIRCMGIGVLSSGSGTDEEDISGLAAAEYHTDTNVYTSFTFVNTTDEDIISSTVFSIRDSNGELPKTSEDAAGGKYIVGERFSPITNDEGITIGMNRWNLYGYEDESVEMKTVKESASVKVFADNPDYKDEYGVAPYVLLGSYKDGEFIDVDNKSATSFKYSIRNTDTGKVIKSGSTSFSCPAGEEAMGWFEWHTPKAAQNIEITISVNNSGVYFLDSKGDRCNTLIVNASIDEVKENTPPDPTVKDKRPSWHKLFTESSVAQNVAQYAPANGAQTLEWYVWTYDWTQCEIEGKALSFDVISSEPTDSPRGKYWGAETYQYTCIASRYGVDNRFYSSDHAQKLSGRLYEGAVLLSGEAHKATFSVTIDAELVVSPSEHCYTAKQDNATGLYTMKSGYGIEVEVRAHISGNTEYCTGSQSANVLFPEFNYLKKGEEKYNRLLEKVGNVFVFKQNEYSAYNDRVHFTPIWYPDNSNYTVYAEVFDVWCPAGQLTVRMTDRVRIKGNVYDDWHVAPVSLG